MRLDVDQRGVESRLEEQRPDGLRALESQLVVAGRASGRVGVADHRDLRHLPRLHGRQDVGQDRARFFSQIRGGFPEIQVEVPGRLGELREEGAELAPDLGLVPLHRRGWRTIGDDGGRFVRRRERGVAGLAGDRDRRGRGALRIRKKDDLEPRRVGRHRARGHAAWGRSRPTRAAPSPRCRSTAARRSPSRHPDANHHPRPSHPQDRRRRFEAHGIRGEFRDPAGHVGDETAGDLHHHPQVALAG